MTKLITFALQCEYMVWARLFVHDVFIGHLIEIALDNLYVFGMNEMYFVRLGDIWKQSLLLDVILIMPFDQGRGLGVSLIPSLMCLTPILGCPRKLVKG